MAETNIYAHPYKGLIEHPRGTFWERTPEGVRLTKFTGNGQVLFSQAYTDADFAFINTMMTTKYTEPPKPEPEPKPEPIPDPAPRATGGTPDVGDVKVSAPRAQPNAPRAART